MPTILIIDDNPMNRETYADLLSDEGHTCITAASGEEGLAKLTGAAFDTVLCDLKLPNLDGLQTMELAHERFGAIPWILITGHGSEETAVKAIKQGAFHYLTKPVDVARLKATIESAARTATLGRENRDLKRQLGFDEALERLVGRSAPMRQLKTMIKQVASSGFSVLIEGESGTGKELVADAIHALSGRHGRPYIKLNMGAIPRELTEAELFGHEKGSFTGAVAQKKGSFERADTGTIFLDEIGELPLDSQVKLLRVLQSGDFHRVGGTQALHSDVRVICATNRSLKQEVLRGTFRMDLFYRLNEVHIRIPALRERREDIPLIANHILDGLNARHHGGKVLTEEVLELLRHSDWPGNVRELENTLAKLYVLSPGKTLDAACLRREFDAQESEAPRQQQAVEVPNDPAALPQVTDAIRALIGLPIGEVERRLILATIAMCHGNKTHAAKKLGIGLKTLYRKLESYGWAG